MKKSFLLLLLLLSLLKTSIAQEQLFRNFYVEAGADFMTCSPPDDKDYIRADIVRYNYYGEPASYVMALFYKNYYGLKYEKRFMANKISWSSGLRYTRTDASIGKDTYWSSKTDYFYFLFDKQGTTTEFLRVKSITQLAHFLGVPVELRIYPYEERKVQLYYKIAMDFNILLGSNTRFEFHDKSMNDNNDRAAAIVEDPWKFYATALLAVGLKIGDSSKPGVNIEACIPSTVLHSTNNSFIDPLFGAGIQINIRFPL